MHLTREQERALNGEFGWAYAKALEIIVKVGESLGADRLISISHAHISGVSYSN
ncbi:MAG: aconitase X, partial [Thermosphaera sp.]